MSQPDPEREAAVDALLRGLCARFAAPPAADSIGRRLVEARRLPVAEAASACGQVLLDAGFVDEAEPVFTALARLFPQISEGRAGLAQIAMRRERWGEALRRWDETLAEFSETRAPAWLAARARVLHELGRSDEARLILEGLARDFPRTPSGPVGLAHLATRRRAWKEALDRWDAVLASFANGRGRPFWEASRASVLTELGQTEIAETMLRMIAAAHPGHFFPFWALLNLLVRTGRQREALRMLEASSFRTATAAVFFGLRQTILIGLRRLGEARELFAQALDAAADVATLDRLLAILPGLYEGWRRTEALLAVQRRLDALRDAVDPAEVARVEVVRARLCLALKDHAGFLGAADRADRAFPEFLGPTLRAIAAALRDPAYPNRREAKVFGIGLSKTGTTSLAAALTSVGWPTIDWRNPLTFELMCEDDLHMFAAFTDTPVCLDFEKYYYLFPNSKFIYTTRPLEAWLLSVEQHWKRQFNLSGFAAIKEALARPDTLWYGTAFADLNFLLYCNHKNFTEAYHAHDHRVRNFFSDKPRHRFLEFNLFRGDGWPELCGFLGCELPATAFPWENRAFGYESEKAALASA